MAEAEEVVTITKRATIFEEEEDGVEELNQKSSLEISTSKPKAHLTRFLLRSQQIKSAYSELSRQFYVGKPADMEKKEYAVERDGLRTLLSNLGLSVSEEEAEEILKMADFDNSKNCQFDEFLTTVGLSIIKLEKEWQCDGEASEDQTAITKAYKSLADLWKGLLDCVPENLETPENHLHPRVWKIALSVSGKVEENEIVRQRLEDLDKDGSASIDLAEFLSTMMEWFGPEDDEEEEEEEEVQGQEG